MGAHLSSVNPSFLAKLVKVGINLLALVDLSPSTISHPVLGFIPSLSLCSDIRNLYVVLLSAAFLLKAILALVFTETV